MREEWDIPRLLAWYSYCERFPPVQAMVQAYLRIKPKRQQTPDTDINTLMADLTNFPGAVPTANPRRRP